MSRLGAGFRGARVQSRSHAPPVGNGPGAMELKRMPLGPHSTARDWPMTFSPALDIAEGTVNGPPFQIHVVRIGDDGGLLALRDPPLAGIERHEERSLGTRCWRSRRKRAATESCGAADEVARGVVDEAGERASVGPRLMSIISWMASGTRMSQATPVTLPRALDDAGMSVYQLARRLRPTRRRAGRRCRRRRRAWQTGLRHHLAEARCRRR